MWKLPAVAVILLPMIITPVIVALIWRYMYDPQFGIINYVLHLLGSVKDVGWLSSKTLALPSVTSSAVTGTSQSASQIAETPNARATVGRACSGISSPSRASTTAGLPVPPGPCPLPA